MSKLYILLFPLWILSSTFIFAQERDIIDAALQEEWLQTETGILLVGITSGSYDPLDLPPDLNQSLSNLNFTGADLILDSDISLGSFAALITQFFDIPGGLLYSIFPEPHYALKELQHLGIVPDYSHPADRISGAKAVEIVQTITQMLEDGEIR